MTRPDTAATLAACQRTRDKAARLVRWMRDDDPVEDGQAECHRCGEWYRVGLLAVPHVCDHEHLIEAAVERINRQADDDWWEGDSSSTLGGGGPTS